jgi:hypothetical protein
MHRSPCPAALSILDLQQWRHYVTTIVLMSRTNDKKIMAITISYARSSIALRGLTPVLNEWCTLVDRYSSTTRSDACYWYNERATLSVLSAAAWRTKGWIGLEEYSTRKFRGWDPDSPDITHSMGRCDVYIASKHGRSQYSCEAKQAWQPIGNDRIKDEYRVLKDKKKKAWADSAKLTRLEATHRLALTLVVPMIAFRQSQGLLTEERATRQVQEWANGLKRLPRVDALAYVFPKHSRLLTNDDAKRVFPGVALLVRERNRRAS